MFLFKNCLVLLFYDWIRSLSSKWKSTCLWSRPFIIMCRIRACFEWQSKKITVWSRSCLQKNMLNHHLSRSVFCLRKFRWSKRKDAVIQSKALTNLKNKFDLFSEFALSIKRPFTIRYNPYNQSIEIVSNTQHVAQIISDLKGDMCIIFDALKKLQSSTKHEFDAVLD